MLPERGTFYLEGDQEGTGILASANRQTTLGYCNQPLCLTE